MNFGETVIELGGTTGNVPLDDAICQFESDDTRSDLLSCWPEYAKKDTERRFNDLIPRANLYSVDEVPTPAENKAKQKGKDILRPSCFMFRDDAEVKKYYTAENIPKFISLYRSCLGGAEEPRDAEDNARAQEDNDKFDLMIPNFGDVSDDRKVYIGGRCKLAKSFTSHGECSALRHLVCNHNGHATVLMEADSFDYPEICERYGVVGFKVPSFHAPLALLSLALCVARKSTGLVLS